MKEIVFVESNNFMELEHYEDRNGKDIRNINDLCDVVLKLQDRIIDLERSTAVLRLRLTNLSGAIFDNNAE